MIRTIYAVLLGVILALFIGFGIEAFYTTEKSPAYPTTLQYAKTDTPVAIAETQKAEQDYDKTLKDYQARNKPHARNVSIFVITGSIILMVLSLTLLSQKDIFADGFLIGSLLTLFYGIIRGFESDDSRFRFIVVTIGLVIALILGYFKFINPEKKKSA